MGRAETRFPVAVIGAIALVVNACGGTVPGTNVVANGGPGASSAPPGSTSVSSSGGQAGSAFPGGSTGPSGGGLVIVAEDTSFAPTELSTSADKAFNLLLQNRDQYTFHDVDIMSEDGSKIIFDGQYIYGPKDITYDIPALPAGTYEFKCSVHPGQMTGTLTVR